MTECSTKFAKETAFEEGNKIRLSAYFAPTSNDDGKCNYCIYNPRLLSIENK